MSNLVIEVCRVESVERHPNAERLAVAVVKGWRTCVRFDPTTGRAEFEPGQKCVYFPPDSVLPPELAHGPEDTPAGRLGVLKYLKQLPRDETGQRPAGGRVAATNLRGQPSYGLIMALDPARGDLDWEVGTDVAAHYGVTKFEPPPEVIDGEADH